MKIYTKTGDKGETGIIGSRLSKGSTTINAIGTVDELNSLIGIVVTKIKSSEKFLDSESNLEILTEVQSAIFDIGAILANGKTTRDFADLTSKLEQKIDLMETTLPLLQNFILPGGSEISSYLHLARSICRRAERCIVDVINESIDQEPTPISERLDVLAFINRLSDYLFVLARYINNRLGYEDIIWSNKNK